MIETRKTFCRFCHVYCGMEADVDTENNRVVAIRGDKDHAVSRGYTCIKGRAELERLYHPERLRTSKKRVDGVLTDIDTEQAMDEIAQRLRAIIDEHGPDAVGVYTGLAGIRFSSSGPWVIRKWMDAIGSRSFFTSYTIDCPSMTISMQRFWGAVMPFGFFDVANADVAMLIGTNPTVSHYISLPQPNPMQHLKDARKRGMKLVVIDPRRSDIAKLADVHLQIKPGEDPTLLAALVKVIVDRDLYDKEYVGKYASGLDQLREAVRPFTLAYAASRTGVPAEKIEAVAEIFAQAPRGAVMQGIGVYMGPHHNLSTQLVMTLNGLCGRFDVPGGVGYKPQVLSAPLPEKPEPIIVPLFTGLKSRVRDIPAINNWLGIEEIPASCLTDEILTPGKGQVRALIVQGGNPALVLADAESTKRALQSLDLLVVSDLFETATGQYADYILASTHPFEQADVPRTMDFYYPVPFMQYTRPLVRPPEGVQEGYEMLWGLAKRLGVDLSVPGISMECKPTADDMLDALLADSRVPMDEIRQYEGGHVWEIEEPRYGFILPDMIGHPDKRMALAHPAVMDELQQVLAEPIIAGGGYQAGENLAFRLVNYRMKEAYCTQGQNLPTLHRHAAHNPLLMNPVDMQGIGVNDGDAVTVDSNFGSLQATVEASEDVAAGVVAMAYGWGDLSAGKSAGVNVQRIIPDDYRFDPVSGLALQTAIPVNVMAAAT